MQNHEAIQGTAVEKLKGAMGNMAYSEHTQKSAAVKKVILGAEKEQQKLLMMFLIKNQGDGNIPTSFQFSEDASVMSDERFYELQENNTIHTDLLLGIISEKLSLGVAADQILGHMKTIKDEDEQDYFLALVMFSEFCPYNFWTGTSISNDEYQEIVNKKEALIQKVIKRIRKKNIRFRTMSERWEYILSLLEGLDSKTRAVVMSSAANRSGGLGDNPLSKILGAGSKFGHGVQVIVERHHLSSSPEKKKGFFSRFKRKKNADPSMGEFGGLSGSGISLTDFIGSLRRNREQDRGIFGDGFPDNLMNNDTLAIMGKRHDHGHLTTDDIKGMPKEVIESVRAMNECSDSCKKTYCVLHPQHDG